MIDYQLIRSNRRTLSISIDGEGSLVVRAPMRMSKREIEAFLTQKQNWIASKQALVRNGLERRQSAQLAQGSAIPFRGGSLIVRFEDVMIPVIAAYLGAGTLFGALGSVFAIRKHLNVSDFFKQG